MRAFFHSFLAAILLCAASCATSPQSIAPTKRTYFRAYDLKAFGSVEMRKVAEIEKRYGIIDAPTPINPPTYREIPRPFSLELRKGRETLSITVLALIDENGETVDSLMLSSSDETVAKEAWPIMRAARYAPAQIGNKPVACVCTFTIEGAGMPR